MNNQYKGSRYIIKHCGTWDNTKNTAYESLSSVYYGGKSYISKKNVPIGIDILDLTFWVQTADYNEQISIINNNVNGFNQTISDMQNDFNLDIANIQNDINLLRSTYAQRHAKNYGEFLDKVRRKEAIKIVFQGDSLFYGQDIISVDKRPAMSDATLDSTYIQNGTQASKTIPEKFKECLIKSYGGITTVLNRGYCGDTAESSYSRWTDSANANMTYIMFGTNDMFSKTPTNFITYISKIIERLIDGGSAVTLFTLPKLSIDNVTATLSFRSMLYNLKVIYGIDIVDTSSFTDGYYYDTIHPNGDSSHFNGVGYSIIGSKMASYFTDCINARKLNIKNGDFITIGLTPYTYLNNGCEYQSNANSKFGLVNSGNDGSAMNIKIGGYYTIPFYTTEKDLVITPIYVTQTAGSVINFQLDYGVTVAPQQVRQFYTLNSIKNTMSFSGDGLGNFNKTTYPYTNCKAESFVIPDEGLHSILVTASGTDNSAMLFGFAVKRFSEITI
jgi:lysophospholipase L1-like esterase